MKEKLINWLIRKLKVDTNKISDGYHTFEELYEHRCFLWIKLCQYHGYAWRSMRHSDGSIWEGWFILGLETKKGKQITYHLPMKYWHLAQYAHTLEVAPEYDGHTPYDVIQRLWKL